MRRCSRRVSRVLDLIQDVMRESFLPDLHAYMVLRFEVQPDRPEEAFAKVAENFIARGRSRFGAGFRYEQEILTDDQCFVNVVECFFLDFFTRNGAPEFTRVLCAMDMTWADDMNTGPYDVAFQRPSLMSAGGDKCRSQFTRQERIL